MQILLRISLLCPKYATRHLFPCKRQPICRKPFNCPSNTHHFLTAPIPWQKCEKTQLGSHEEPSTGVSKVWNSSFRACIGQRIFVVQEISKGLGTNLNTTLDQVINMLESIKDRDSGKDTRTGRDELWKLMYGQWRRPTRDENR